MSSYIPIQSVTLASAANSVTFTSIPTTKNGKTLRDLVVIASPIGVSNQFETLDINYNTSGGAYNMIWMRGDGSSIGSSSLSASDYIVNDQGWDSVRTTTGTVFIYHFFDFAQTDKHKSIIIRTNRADLRTVATGARWANTNAITDLRFRLAAGGTNFAAGTRYELYGIEG